MLLVPHHELMAVELISEKVEMINNRIYQQKMDITNNIVQKRIITGML